MHLFKLAVKNIKKSLGDYTLYFFTIVLGVSLFYSFNTIDHQTAMIQLNHTQMMLVDMILWILKLISVFVAIVLGFLIIYANNFLLKRRKKEFAMYMLLGMSKWQISKILWMETMILGILSLFVGMGVGILFSQAMAIFVASFFKAKIATFKFIISIDAIMQTCLYFGITFLIVILFNVGMIGHTRLISLFKAKEKRERTFSKNGIVCVLALGCAIYLLYKNYIIVSTPNVMLDFNDVTQILFEGALGTYLVFFSLSGLMLKAMQLFKGHYFKNLNSFILREFSYTINHTVALMSIVCLMLFMTITVLSSAMTIKKHDEDLLKKNFPCDFQAVYYLDNFEKDFQSLPIDQYQLDSLEKTSIYVDQTMTYNHIFQLGTKGYERLIANWGWGNNLVPIVSYSEYEKVCQLFGIEPLPMKNDQFLLACNMTSYKPLYDEVLEAGLEIKVNGTTLKNANELSNEWFYQLDTNYSNDGIVIVPDACVRGLEVQNIYLTGNFKTNVWQEKEMIVENTRHIDVNEAGFFTNNIVDATFYSVRTSTVLIFIGLYLGTTFLIACAALLALKQLCDVADNQQRYDILKKLGTNQKEINQAVFKQNALFFLAPLVLALVHSYYGIQFITNLYAVTEMVNLSEAMFSCAMIFAFIYDGYFIVTYMMQKRILER